MTIRELMDMKFELLGVDEFKDDFAVFYIDRGELLNAYIWVYSGGKVRVTDIYGLASYCRHAVSPIYVGRDMPEELIRAAREKLEGLSVEEFDSFLSDFSEKDKMRLEHGAEDYKERQAYEAGTFEEIMAKRADPDGMMWFM